MTTDAKQPPASPRPPVSFWGWPLFAAVLVLLLDQGSKLLITCHYPIGWNYALIEGFFDLVHVRNTGAAWGILNRHTWLLSLMSVAAFAALLMLFKRWNAGNRPTAFALAILQGGIAGNMLDRIFRKSVVDFLDFHIGEAHWPAFNVADSAICVSVALLLILSFFVKSDDAKETAVHVK